MRSLDTIGPRRSLIAPVLAGTLAFVVAACGGAAPMPTPDDTGADQERIEAAIDDLVAAGGIDISSSDEDETAAEQPAIEPVQQSLGQEAWFAGFHITFDELSLVMDGRRGDLHITASFENLGRDESRMDATIKLMSGGQPVSESFDMDIPSVPSGETVDGTFGFAIDEDFNLDDAVLTLGTPAVQQVVLPLGASSGEFVSLEPTTLSLSGAATAGQLELKVDGGELRADRPERHGQMESGKLALTVTYAATNHGTGAADFPFTGENVRLKLPDGSVIADLGDGLSQSIELLPAGTSKTDLLTRFEVADPASGQYALQVVEGDQTAEIPFSLP
jgi:hypothetical protein